MPRAGANALVRSNETHECVPAKIRRLYANRTAVNGLLQAMISALMGPPARWRAARALRRAVRLRESGALAEAAALLEREVAQDSRSVEARVLLSDIRRELGQIPDAVRLAREAVMLAPAHADAHSLLAVAQALAGEHAEAAGAYAAAVRHDPLNARRRMDLATTLLAMDRAAEAAAQLEEVIARDAGHAAALALLGLAMHRQGRPGKSLRCLERSLQIDPTDVQALNNYALVLRDAGRHDEAEEALRKVLARRPDDPGAANNLAVALADRGRHAEARALVEPLVAAMPEMLEPRCTLARILLDQGDAVQAVAHLDRAVADHPRSADARLARAVCRLALGDFAGGWDDYAFRTGTLETPARGFPLPEWDGDDPAAKSIMVYAEQGIGDEIMFAGCYAELIAEARGVTLECDPRLAPLWRRSFAGASVVADRSRGPHAWIADAGPIDVQVPAGSLPRRYRRSRAAFPRHGGYLAPDPEKLARYRARLDALGPGFRVGLAWRGGVAKTRRALRSIEPAQLRVLLERSDTRFICLQHGPGEQDLAALAAIAGPRVHHWPDALADVDETAALLCALDHTVTVCNYLVHLGGALGRDVRVAVPASPEWRYLRAGADMPWYPSVRLFRQQDAVDWEPVLRRIAASW